MTIPDSPEMKPPCDCAELQPDGIWLPRCECDKRDDERDVAMWCGEQNEKKRQAETRASTGSDEGLRSDAQFLLDRLNELELDEDDSIVRDWFGHVQPAMDRLKHRLESPASPESGAAAALVCAQINARLGEEKFSPGWLAERLYENGYTAPRAEDSASADVVKVLVKKGRALTMHLRETDGDPMDITLVADLCDLIERLQADLDTVLAREAATIERHDKRVAALQAQLASAVADVRHVLTALRYHEEATGESFDDEGGVIAQIEQAYPLDAPQPAQRDGR